MTDSAKANDLLAQLPKGKGPAPVHLWNPPFCGDLDMEIRADGKELWATARFARKVQVVNLEQKKLSHSIPVGRSPHGVSFISHAPRL